MKHVKANRNNTVELHERFELSKSTDSWCLRELETKWTKELTVRSCVLNFPTFYSNWLLIELVFDVSANIVNINKYWRRNLSSSLSYHYFLDVALDSILLKSTTSFSVLDLNTKVIYLHLQHAAIHTHATHSTVLYLAGGYARKSSFRCQSSDSLSTNERSRRHSYFCGEIKPTGS